MQRLTQMKTFKNVQKDQSSVRILLISDDDFTVMIDLREKQLFLSNSCSNLKEKMFQGA